MPTDPNGLLRLIILSVTAPRLAASTLIATRLSRSVLWQALALVTVLSVLLVSLTQGPVIEMPIGGRAPILVTPFAYAAILGACLVMLVFALDLTGRSLGGTGDFVGALTIVVWLEVLGIALSALQALLLLVNADIAAIVSLVGLGVTLWILVSFVNVLHDFDSMGKALLTLVLAMVGIIFGIAVILAVIGVSIPEGASHV